MANVTLCSGGGNMFECSLQTSANKQLVWLISWELWLNPIKKFKIQKNVQNIFSTYMKIMRELSHALKHLMLKNGLNLDAHIPYL